MALRLLQFGIVFAIGYCLGPASPFAGAADVPKGLQIPLAIQLKDPKDVTVSRGQSAVLRCDAKSLSSGLQVTWLHNNKTIKSNDTRRYVRENSSLYFPNVGGGRKNKGLTGEYVCRATVQNVSIVSNPAKLKLASFGDFNKQPSNLSVPESQPAVLPCSIHSVPAAHIKWDLLLPHNTRYVPLPTGALLITKTHSSDTGSYRCIATNSLLKKTKYSSIVQLTVTSSPTKTVAPTFLPLEILPNTTVLVGRNANLYCAVTGWPIPTVQWLNNSIVISNSTVLQFRNVSLYDGGNYSCVAYNSGGRSLQNYSLNVQQKPFFNVTPTSQTFPSARTVRLDCQVFGFPKPEVYWLKNGEPLSSEFRIKRHPTGLVISHTFTSDAGIYQCVGVNAAGTAWAAAQLVPTFFDTPSPPENVQCRAFDETSLCLTWQPPQNVSVAAYSIYCYYTAMEHEFSGREFLTNETLQLASGLNRSTNYTCYVRLYSKIASDPSEKVTCETGVKGRRNLQFIRINESSARFSWSPVSTDVPCDGTKEKYAVQWKQKGRSMYATNYTEEFVYVVSGLNHSLEYEFRVLPTWVKNDNSPWVCFTLSHGMISANAIDLIPLSLEKLKASPVSATSINLTWFDTNENTKYYSICVIKNKLHNSCESELIKSESNNLQIDYLQPNQTYEFKVRAHNYNGDPGPFSQSVTSRTHAAVPSQIFNLNYEIVNETAVCLHWQAPLRKNAKLTSYLILYTPDADWRPLDDWFNKSVPTTQSKLKGCWSGERNDHTFSTLLVNLDPDKIYTVYVRAATEEVGLMTKISRNVIPQQDDVPRPDDIQYNQKLGIIMGVTISLACIFLFVSCILVRKRCLKTRAFARARMAASNNYYPAVAQYASEDSSVQVRLESPCSADVHEIEHLVSDDCTTHIPAIVPTHLDTKGVDGFPNGHINGSAKPYINGHIANGIVHITENPRYYALECNGHVDKKPKSEEVFCAPYEEDSNSNLKTSKFHDLHRIFERSKTAEVRPPSSIQCNSATKLQDNPQNNVRRSPSSSDEGSLNSTQVTCLDNSFVVSANNHRRVSPILGPNG